MVLNRTGERTVVSANAAVFSSLQARLNPRWLQGVSVVQVDGHYMRLCIAGASGHTRVEFLWCWRAAAGKMAWKSSCRLLTLPSALTTFWPPGCRDEKDVLEFLDGGNCGWRSRAALRLFALPITISAAPSRWKRLGRWIRLAPAISFMAPSAITFASGGTFARLWQRLGWQRFPADIWALVPGREFPPRITNSSKLVFQFAEKLPRL